MADQGWALTLRMTTATLALVCTFAVVVAVFVTGYFKGLQGGGDLMTSVLVAPIALVFYGGPPLLALSMASRSRSMFAALVALTLTVVIAGLFVALGVGPWEFKHWSGHPNEAQTKLLIGMLFGVWPVTGGAGLLWIVANRRK